MDQEKTSIVAIRDVIVTIREATVTVVVLLIVLLLFLSPESIKTTLSEAGFKSVSIPGLGEMELQEMQNELETAKSQVEVARDELNQVEEKFQQVNTTLTSLKRTASPAEKERIEIISRDIRLSKEKAATIKRDLTKTIKKQDQILEKIKVQQIR
jgi:septal ring factor EnvC (AmiA/AmiB activator)